MMPRDTSNPSLRISAGHWARGKGWRYAIACLFLLGSSMASADIESPLAIKEAARDFIVASISSEFPQHKIRVSDLDPRLQLSSCDAPLEAFLPPGGHAIGNTGIGVRCPGHKPWTVYLTATITGIRDVVVAKRPIVRGSIIGQDDVMLKKTELIGSNKGYIYDPANVIGKIAKRAMTISTPLSPRMLSAPLMIRRGQKVTILAQTGGIEVRMRGTALMDGAEGQLIQAKNTLSKRIIEGLVIKPGIIQVTM